MSEIHFLTNYKPSLQSELQNLISQWHDEVSRLLPTLPAVISIEFDNQYLTPGFGTGGVAFDLHTIKLAYDPHFDASPDALIAELRATYFHEAYHLARSFSFETTPHDLPALWNAIEEGLATKFEVTRTKSKPGYEQYEDRETMMHWLQEVRSLPDGFDYDWQRWKFFDPQSGRKWVLYKVGVFVTDEALRNSPDLTIEKLSMLGTEEILKLSQL